MCNQSFQQNITYINDETKNNFNKCENINPGISRKDENCAENKEVDDFEVLNTINIINANRQILAQLNINSLRNKFDALTLIIKDKVHILVCTETKLDDFFTDAKFSIVGFKAPVRLDRTASGGGIIVYIRDSIPSKFLGNLPSDEDSEGLFIELNLRNTKWILFAGYNPRRVRISPFLSNIEHMLNKYIHSYDGPMV